MLILRRSSFVIHEIGNDPPPVPGYISDHFGAHQHPIIEKWGVYHLQSGYSVSHRQYNFWEARGFIETLESSGLNWVAEKTNGNWSLADPTFRLGRWLVKNFESGTVR
jgi:hypothetical protein